MWLLIKRNSKLFFKDKGMFFTALITPAILLVLYATFLGNVYRDSFVSSLPEGVMLSQGVIDGLVGSQLVSSILAVSCVTVAFSANFVMVQDKANGTVKDLKMSPVTSATLSMSYYIATLLSTLLICFAATGFCLLYLLVVGWYMSGVDVLLLLVDVLILALFGTALSSMVNLLLSTQGQISAASAIVSSGYGFICGAYMPISSFGDTLQQIVMCLPGTYGTSLVRNHAMQGAFSQMLAEGVPSEAIDGLKESLDCRLFLFGNEVEMPMVYGILLGAVALLVGGYVLLNTVKKDSI